MQSTTFFQSRLAKVTENSTPTCYRVVLVARPAIDPIVAPTRIDPKKATINHPAPPVDFVANEAKPLIKKPASADDPIG